MKCIVIDGWHKGQVIEWREPQPTIRLLKPKTVTLCDCDPNISEERFESLAEQLEYKLAFIAIDRKVALYSVSGDSLKVFDSFIHRHYAKPFGSDTVLEFGCHDERAWR
jgi:hypothetical protein